jgi:hypothetical protein
MLNIDIINNYIDCCIGSNGSHYDISLVIYNILKDSYRYIGNNTWEYNDNNLWIVDEKNMKLKYSIKVDVNNYFIDRSKYWLDMNNNNDINLEIDNKHKSLKILQYSNKLKDDKFISQIIKEVKQFYE